MKVFYCHKFPWWQLEFVIIEVYFAFSTTILKAMREKTPKNIKGEGILRDTYHEWSQKPEETQMQSLKPTGGCVLTTLVWIVRPPLQLTTTSLFKYYIFKETALTPYSFWPSIQKKVAGFPGVLSTENPCWVGKIYTPQAEKTTKYNASLILPQKGTEIKRFSRILRKEV